MRFRYFSPLLRAGIATIGALALLGGSAATAQSSKVQEARGLLGDQQYQRAIPVIDEAVRHADTKDDAEAWFLRGMAYFQKALDPAAASTAAPATEEAYTSLMRALKLKPDYGTEIDQGLYGVAALFFNQGAAEYEQSPAVAYAKFQRVLDIRRASGARLGSHADFQALAGSAMRNAAYSAMQAGMEQEAAAILEGLKTSAPPDTAVYQMLAMLYESRQENAKLLALINEGRAAFPAYTALRDIEINYYLRHGPADVLRARLEDAARADPDNAEIQFSLGNAYTAARFPADGATVPAEADALTDKAAKAYAIAVRLQPRMPDYHYNAGLLHYRAASELIRQSQAITGTSAADNKAFDALEARWNAQFGKALPFFEEAQRLLEAQPAGQSKDDAATYVSVLTGLREIYSRTKDGAKQAAVEARLNAGGR